MTSFEMHAEADNAELLEIIALQKARLDEQDTELSQSKSELFVHRALWKTLQRRRKDTPMAYAPKFPPAPSPIPDKLAAMVDEINRLTKQLDARKVTEQLAADCISDHANQITGLRAELSQVHQEAEYQTRRAVEAQDKCRATQAALEVANAAIKSMIFGVTEEGEILWSALTIEAIEKVKAAYLAAVEAKGA